MNMLSLDSAATDGNADGNLKKTAQATFTFYGEQHLMTNLKKMAIQKPVLPDGAPDFWTQTFF
jgi:hypothetical protein